MAKKNLASLMSGIMGEPEPAAVLPQEEVAAPAAEPAVEVKEEPVAQEKPRRRRTVGRPRKGEERVKSDEIRATFIVDPEVVRKVKYISLVEGNLLKEVIDEALIAYIANWEAANGRIPLPKKKN